MNALPSRSAIQEEVRLLGNLREEVRTVSHNLASPHFNIVSLKEIVKEYVRCIRLYNKIEVQLFIDEIDWQALSPKMLTEIYRVLQESLSNILKHAQAATVTFGVKELLTRHFPQMNVYVATTEAAIWQMSVDQVIDIYVLDYEFPQTNATQLIPRLKEHNADARFIIHTIHQEIGVIAQLVKIKVNKILLKGAPTDELIMAINQVLCGKRYYMSEIKEIMLNAIDLGEEYGTQLYQPSIREREVIQLLSNGKNSQEISEKIFLSKYTIDTIRKNILKKSGCDNVAQLVRMAVLSGWVD